MNRFAQVLFYLGLLGAGDAQAEGHSCSKESAQIYLQNTFSKLQKLYELPHFLPPHIVIRSEDLTLSLSDKTAIFGYFDSQTNILHVACKVGSMNSLEASVGHEATHYYLAQAFGQLPLWLNEGMATYMEVGNDLEDGVAYKINRRRLKEFDDLLKHGRVPPLLEILTQNPFSNHPSQYYSTYWALVFSLMHHTNSNIQQQRRRLLLDLLNNTDHSPETLNNQLIQGLLTEDTTTLADWELSWRRQIWGLNSDVK